MQGETNTSSGFKVENCRAKHSVADLADCLAPEQSGLCGFSLPFGNGCFCKHPRRNEFIEMTQKMRNELKPPTEVLQFDQ